MNEGRAAPMVARDAVIGLFLIGFAIVVWLGAEGLPKSPLGGQIGADGFPKLLAGSLGVLALLLIIQTLLGRSGSASREPSVPVEASASPQDHATAPTARQQHIRAAGMLAIGIVYVAVLETLGFVLSTLLMLLAVALYNGRRATLGLAAVAVAGATLLYLLFVRVLGVPLPPGFWSSLVS